MGCSTLDEKKKVKKKKKRVKKLLRLKDGSLLG
jgi:hypothetical protein